MRLRNTKGGNMILVAVLSVLLATSVGVKMMKAADEYRYKLMVEDCEETNYTVEDVKTCIDRYLHDHDDD
jgi:steroid 5-alpha reductase family enzyme